MVFLFPIRTTLTNSKRRNKNFAYITCVSVRWREEENSALSAIVRYCFSRNFFSRDSSCCVVKGVRGFRFGLCFRNVHLICTGAGPGSRRSPETSIGIISINKLPLTMTTFVRKNSKRGVIFPLTNNKFDFRLYFQFSLHAICVFMNTKSTVEDFEKLAEECFYPKIGYTTAAIASWQNFLIDFLSRQIAALFSIKCASDVWPAPNRLADKKKIRTSISPSLAYRL